MSCDPTVALISSVSGGLSIAAWIVAQLPQLFETYRTKSVEGLSPIFISIWVLGDVCSFIGCVLTEQMFFQYLLAAYFLFNDLVLVGQYWYYGYYLKIHKHRHHHHHHHHHHHQDDPEYGSTLNTAANAAKSILPAVVIASQVGRSEAYPLYTTTISREHNKLMIGTMFAWIGAGLYFFSRIPQLLKNYQRKSTEDVSPFLFGCTLFGNATYATSILISCSFIYGDDRWGFFLNELPYMIGSAGTIIFDLVYFYQLWLYSVKDKSDDEAPLLSNS